MVLDFGCGTGANCSICRPEQYCGIDPDSKRVHFAKRSFPHYTFEVFDGKRLPLPDQTVDLILIVAVLHHISNGLIAEYLNEFRRVLKAEGNIMAIEPYLCQKSKFNNWFMNRYDQGEHIRKEEDYIQLFKDQNYDCQVLKKFKKCLLYNEIFFVAAPY